MQLMSILVMLGKLESTIILRAKRLMIWFFEVRNYSMEIVCFRLHWDCR